MTYKSLQLNIHTEDSILFALKRMDEIRRKLLLVVDEEKYVGLLSIGDIQRAIINNADLKNSVSSIMRKDYITSKPDDSVEEVKLMMINIRSEFMPVIDEKGNLVNVYFWEDFFGEKKPKPVTPFNLPVAIMAGGYGSRLKPLTNVIPKPLIPIGEKTMLEEIFDRFAFYGCQRFFISVNYKADLIRYYIQNQNLTYDIKFFEEDRPLGTAGSLGLLKGQIDQTFFVSNCDILIDQDYSEILNYHINNNNELTVVAALKHFPIAYGTIETGESGQLTALTEKPEFTFKINSGMYILEPHLINEIPDNEIYHITDFISKLQREGRKLGVFPVLQSSWLDIGDLKGYIDILSKYNTLNLTIR
jgi:dTDP-glucose pyrophosphorylase